MQYILHLNTLINIRQTRFLIKESLQFLSISDLNRNSPKKSQIVPSWSCSCRFISGSKFGDIYEGSRMYALVMYAYHTQVLYISIYSNEKFSHIVSIICGVTSRHYIKSVTDASGSLFFYVNTYEIEIE